MTGVLPGRVVTVVPPGKTLIFDPSGLVCEPQGGTGKPTNPGGAANDVGEEAAAGADDAVGGGGGCMADGQFAVPVLLCICCGLELTCCIF